MAAGFDGAKWIPKYSLTFPPTFALTHTSINSKFIIHMYVYVVCMYEYMEAHTSSINACALS